MSHAQRYFEMLGAAYEVPSQTDSFDAFLSAATAYFFEQADATELAPDLPRHTGEDDALETHGQRIGALIEAASRRGPEDAERFHAIFEISARTGLVTGNEAAFQLTGCSFPCPLDDLPFDRTAVNEIRATLRSAEHQKQDRIILASVGDAQAQACLALIQRPKDTADRVQVSLSYVDWSESLMTRLADAFGLTLSEKEILEGFLENLGQKDIAEKRGRSVETVKGQSKSILRKTGCARMSDVVQLCASIAFLLRQLPDQASPPSAETWVTPKEGMQFLARPKGRKLAWYTIGQGQKPVLFVHGYLQGPYVTQAFRRALAETGTCLIAPSRPGFGYTSPSVSRADFNDTVVSDALALVDHLGLEKISLCLHQGGTSHGYRIAAALGPRMGDMLVIGGGIPIDENAHLSHMDPQTRFAAMATRHAPSIMKMVMSVGLPVYRRRGTRAFLEKQFSKSASDLATLSDRTLWKVQADGLYHAVEQGGGAWVRDGAAAMADWTADLEAVDCRQIWLQAGEDSIISAEDVKARITQRPNVEFHILEGHGTNVLHTAIDDVTRALSRLQ